MSTLDINSGGTNWLLLQYQLYIFSVYEHLKADVQIEFTDLCCQDDAISFGRAEIRPN